MKLMRSFLMNPGEIRYGRRRRTTSRGIAARLRLYFGMVAIRSFILARVCFLPQANFDAKGFITFKAVADPWQWGLAFLAIGVLLVISTLSSSGTAARYILTVSGAITATVGFSFLSSALNTGSGWWGAIAYLTIGLTDFLVASYPGEDE